MRLENYGMYVHVENGAEFGRMKTQGKLINMYLN